MNCTQEMPTEDNGYLGEIDKLFGAPVTTCNGSTILAVVRILEGQEKNATN